MVLTFRGFVRSVKFFITVDGYDVDECLESFWCLLPGIGIARYCWLYIVVVLTFTSGGVDLRAHLSIDHRRVSFFSRV